MTRANLSFEDDIKLRQMGVDPTQPIPIYFQLKTLLLEEILEGRYGTDGRPPDGARVVGPVRDQPNPGDASVVRAGGGGRDPPAPAAAAHSSTRMAAPQDRGSRRCVLSSRKASGAAARRCGPRRDDSERRHGAAAVAAPGADARGGRGRAPDLAVVDSIWIAEFAASGFLHALEDLDGDWSAASTTMTSWSRSSRRTAPEAARSACRRSAPWPGSGTAAGARRPRARAPDHLGRAARRRARSPTRVRHTRPPSPAARRRRDDGVLPCRLPRLERRQRPDESGIVLDSPATAETLAYLRELIDDELVAAEVVAYEWTRPIRLLAEGRAVLSVGGQLRGRGRSRLRSGLRSPSCGTTSGSPPSPQGHAADRRASPAR